MPANMLYTWIADERDRNDAPTAGFRDSVLTL